MGKKKNNFFQCVMYMASSSTTCKIFVFKEIYWPCALLFVSLSVFWPEFWPESPIKPSLQHSRAFLSYKFLGFARLSKFLQQTFRRFIKPHDWEHLKNQFFFSDSNFSTLVCLSLTENIKFLQFKGRKVYLSLQLLWIQSIESKLQERNSMVKGPEQRKTPHIVM